MAKKGERPSTYDVLHSHGVTRRSFLKFCTLTTAALGLDSTFVPLVVQALYFQQCQKSLLQGGRRQQVLGYMTHSPDLLQYQTSQPLL